MRVEQVTDSVAYHGERPVWSPRWGGLRWVDMLATPVREAWDQNLVPMEEYPAGSEGPSR